MRKSCYSAAGESTDECMWRHSMTARNERVSVAKSRFKFQALAVCVALMTLATTGWGQTTIFSENMGTPAGTTAIASNAFQNGSPITFSGATADVRNTSVSTGYTGASGGGNVFFTSTGGNANFVISGINTSGFSSMSLSFGISKSTNASNGSEFVVEVSSDGTNYTALSFTSLPTGTGTTGYYLKTTTGNTRNLWAL
jgi:hypothetical protein